MNSSESAAVRGMIAAGIAQHSIAALFQVNPGRIAETKKSSEAMLEVEARDGIPVLSLDLVDILSSAATERGLGGLLHGVFVYTPDLCRDLIDKRKARNDGNRKFKITKVKTEFVPDMQDLAWKLNGETLKFSDSGTMVDGQNRCMACSLAGTEFSSLSVFGVPRSYFSTVDIGKPRNGADLFTFHGVKNAHVASGSVRWIMIFRSRTPQVAASFPPQDMLKYYIENVDPVRLQTSLTVARPVHVRRRDIAHSLLCGLHYVLSEVNNSRADAFFLSWSNSDEWFRPLNARLDDLAGQYRGRSRPQYLTVGNIIQAWNVWRKKQVLKMSGRNSLTYQGGPIEAWS